MNTNRNNFSNEVFNLCVKYAENWYQRKGFIVFYSASSDDSIMLSHVQEAPLENLKTIIISTERLRQFSECPRIIKERLFYIKEVGALVHLSNSNRADVVFNNLLYGNHGVEDKKEIVSFLQTPDAEEKILFVIDLMLLGDERFVEFEENEDAAFLRGLFLDVPLSLIEELSLMIFS